MNKKKDRGAAKVVNFCLAAGTKVLTKSGYKAIEDVMPADRLWDGKEWVKHKGVVSRGKKLVIPLWDRTLWCTPDHIVYTSNGPELAKSVWELYKNKHRGPRPVRVQWDAKTRSASTVDPSFNYHVSSELMQLQHLYRMMHELGNVWSEESCREHLKVTDPAKAVVRFVETYDIVDVGKNNRFVANGVLVHNSSSYGGTATSISRKIEADTGIKATPEEAQALLDAVEQRQPRATEFFKEMEKAPELYGQLKAASGRIRHCHMLAKDVAGMTRTREGQLTALGRECRNFFMQESVGSSASRACVSMVDFHLRMKEQYNLQGYPCVCLYDSIVVHCPVEERHIWAKALDLFMNLSDGWYTPGGILRYPTDCEFNAGWSTKPDKEFKKQLHDANWNPTPSHLKPVEDWLDAMIKLYTDNPDLSVYNKQDKPHE